MWTHEEEHPGEFLRARFLEPLGISASTLAAACHMSRSRVSDILAGKRGISADTALRLGAFFRMEPEQWLALQADWELSQAAPCEDITPLDPPGFLLGPKGATPIPQRRPPRPKLIAPQRATGERSTIEPADPVVPTTHEEVRYADGTRAMVATPK